MTAAQEDPGKGNQFYAALARVTATVMRGEQKNGGARSIKSM